MLQSWKTSFGTLFTESETVMEELQRTGKPRLDRDANAQDL